MVRPSPDKRRNLVPISGRHGEFHAEPKIHLSPRYSSVWTSAGSVGVEMRMVVSNRLRIEDPSPELISWCKKNLVLANPDYTKKARMNLWLGNTPQKLYLMEWDGNTLVLPYGCFNDVLR